VRCVTCDLLQASSTTSPQLFVLTRSLLSALGQVERCALTQLPNHVRVGFLQRRFEASEVSTVQVRLAAKQSAAFVLSCSFPMRQRMLVQLCLSNMTDLASL